MSTREELTRQAEKCLRQGRLDEAIAQYQELAYLEPVDWGLVKQLADLLERTGQREGAARQFARWADHLLGEGFHSKSAALYKKVLKLEPADEHALWQLGEVSLQLKLRADARLVFQRVADLRQRRGDVVGAAAARDRLASFEITPTGATTAPPTPPAYLAPDQAPAEAPSADAPAGPSPSAREAPAVPTPAAAALSPDAPVPVGPPETIAPPDETPGAQLARLRRAAEDADALGRPDADGAWLAVLDMAPEDVAVRLRLVQAACDRGAFETASDLAASLDATEEPALVVLIELAHRSGRVDVVDRLILDRVQAGTGRQQVLAPVDALAERHPGAARAALASAVAAWTAGGQPGHAVAALEHAQARGLLTTDLYLQWVDICVDAGLPSLSRAQHALAVAYLSEHRFGEARAVAEDLFIRDAGAEPARTLLLDILDREGVPQPQRILVDLLTPPSESADEDVPPDAPGDATPPEDIEPLADHLPPWRTPLVTAMPAGNPDGTSAGFEEAAVDDAPQVFADGTAPTPFDEPDQPESAVSAPAPTVFNWSDLLGRDVAPGVTKAEVLVEPDASPFADTNETPLFSQVRNPSSFEDAPLQPSFAMPRAWLLESPGASSSQEPPRRAMEDDFLFPAAAAPPPPVASETIGAAKVPPPDPVDDHTPVEQSPLDLPDSPESGGQSPGLIEEEIDLTQLLEELKQWDPLLPEPLVRAKPGASPEVVAGDSAAGPEDTADDPERGTVVGAAETQAVAAPLADLPSIAEHPPVDPVSSDGSGELDAVFADLHRPADDRAVAEQQLAAGRVFLAAGLVSEAARAFERASLAPRSRFDAALALAELHRSRGQVVEAVSWYEQATTAAVPDAAVKRAVLYDLAESLEALGESERALGVLLDLLSQVEDYRDARARLDRLLRVDAGG